MKVRWCHHHPGGLPAANCGDLVRGGVDAAELGASATRPENPLPRLATRWSAPIATWLNLRVDWEAVSARLARCAAMVPGAVAAGEVDEWVHSTEIRIRSPDYGSDRSTSDRSHARRVQFH